MEKTKQSNKVKSPFDSKKEALLNAGLELFGRYGLEATSTRMLAAKSGTNIAAIPYYFDSKEGLYRAVVQHVAQNAQTFMWPVFQRIEAQLNNDATVGPKRAASCLCELVEQMFSSILQFDKPASWVQIMVREQADPTGAFDTFYKAQMKPMQSMLARLIGLCLNLDPSSENVKIRVHALMGQILFFIIGPEGLLRQLNTRKLKPEHIGVIKEVLIEHVLACVRCPHN